MDVRARDVPDALPIVDVRPTRQATEGSKGVSPRALLSKQQRSPWTDRIVASIARNALPVAFEPFAGELPRWDSAEGLRTLTQTDAGVAADLPGIPVRHIGDANPRRRRVLLGRCFTNAEGGVM
jgi:hypothetical protein